ncbi:helix-turn-helix transcriptional regulator [Sporosarcina sp. ANT_H38]|uniref:helix-turn-helix transcriptional regulator n=1 Tax=Sporosarcina sp. ANT_H38 TaxID=2597358 RepID=UPI0011F20D3C|nr:helix-turn-helix transcriptional regulator [Sporosarcina sp. ANT_H38]KAA0944117.1 helix-turn-helix transcriptional regulator [Sporosarcina sp. ANT_H38]
MREWLKEIREGAQLTQAEAAEKCGMARATYGSIESGIRGATVANAKRIANVFDFHWTIFFEDESRELKNNRNVV